MVDGSLELVWHYTVLSKVKLIQKESTLRPFGKSGQVPAVWFSLEQEWEPTAACNWLATKPDGTTEYLDRDQLYRELGGLYRFGVHASSAPLTWDEIKAEITESVRAEMLEGAADLGANPTNWRASKCEIGPEKWIVVQMWDGNQWKTCGKK